jgi:hypothetical protein
MRLEKKIILPTSDHRSSRIIRRFDQACTPLDRLIATKSLLADQTQALLALRHSTNPCLLRRQIYSLLQQLFALPLADPGISQDVFLTLFKPLDSMNGVDPSVTLSNDCTVPVR